MQWEPVLVVVQLPLEQERFTLLGKRAFSLQHINITLPRMVDNHHPMTSLLYRTKSHCC